METIRIEVIRIKPIGARTDDKFYRGDVRVEIIQGDKRITVHKAHFPLECDTLTMINYVFLANDKALSLADVLGCKVIKRDAIDSDEISLEDMQWKK
jgi:hypothetical protein